MKIKTESKMLSRKLIKNSAYLLYNMANISKEEKLKIDLPKKWGKSSLFNKLQWKNQIFIF